MSVVIEDTIFALATPNGRSGVAVIRASGPASWGGVKALINNDIIPRQAQLCALKNPQTKDIIDHALVLGFKAPASFTGEDVVEYHVHGGAAVIAEMLDVLGALEHHRMAEPGEFTKRAFVNDKMDLTGAEAIADLIDATTQAQKAQALAQMGGALSDLYAGWTETLKKALAHMEADLEFPDEDLPEGVAPQILPVVQELIDGISDHLDDNRRGERLRDGIHVAVIGAPNAGKSSLINMLSQRDVAIVSDMAGTTRDIIDVHLDLGGYPVILSDTAGLRPDQIGGEGHDAIESEGIRRALKRAEEADIKLLLFDGALPELDGHTIDLFDDNALVIINKIDTGRIVKTDKPVIEISAETGWGINALINALVEKAQNLVGQGEAPSLTRTRHRVALEECRDALLRAQGASLPELMAEDMRLAIRAVGRITGKVDVEDLLDVIFRDFCIGK